MSELILPPSEFSGESGTAVGGRVVLVRMTKVKGKGGGRGKGRGKPLGEERDKCEVHLMGGQGMSEVLYVEAWSEAAGSLGAVAVFGRLLRIEKAQVVPQRPQYSTSRLPYYLRLVSPVGLRTLVQEMQGDVGEPWSSIPLHHPFVSLADMERVEDSLNVCVLAVVARQPGEQTRNSPYGQAGVCNAVLRLKDTTIRCSFWRALATTMSSFVEGSVVAIYQTVVKKVTEGEWELRGTESTSIQECPDDLREMVLSDTNLTQRPGSPRTWLPSIMTSSQLSPRLLELLLQSWCLQPRGN